MSGGPPRPPDEAATRDGAARAYLEFLRGTRDAGDAFYGEQTVRFELREGDVLAAPDDTRVEDGPSGVSVVSDRGGVRVAVSGVSGPEVRRILASIDGRRTVATLRASFPGPALPALLESAFGRVVFAPFAVMDLEKRLSASEIVRYPGSPYEVVRTYWENMIAVAERIDREIDRVTRASFFGFLQELHRTALTGERGQSFYRPASPIVRKRGVLPGALLDEPTLLDETGPEIRFVSGTRVAATPIGGVRFQDLLAECTDDPASRLGDRTFVGDDGTPWGRVVTARAAGDAEAAPWFCPPRPITTGHWETVHTALLRAHAARRRQATADVATALARFHQAFLRLHPFAAGNQSVVMSLVNHVLRESHGAGLPHLVLDHVALRLSSEAYARVFELATREWIVFSESPANRARTLGEKRQAVFRFLADLAKTGSHEEARAMAAARPDEARLALLGV